MKKKELLTLTLLPCNLPSSYLTKRLYVVVRLFSNRALDNVKMW